MLELEKNLEDLKRNLSALRESSVGKKFCVILGKKFNDVNLITRYIHFCWKL